MPADSDLIATINQVASQRPLPIGYNAVVTSYDPKNGTVDAILGDTAALANLPGDTPMYGPLVLKDIPILSLHVGHMGGPIGGERAILLHTQDGYAALLHHGPDDSPNTLPGELWSHMQSVIPLERAKNFTRIQKDAVRLSHLAKINLLAPFVNLGLEQGIAQQGVVRLQDLQQAINNVLVVVQNAINALAAETQAGPGVAAPRVAPVTGTSSLTTFSK